MTYCNFTVLDATSKEPEGFLDGNTYSFGNFDQCQIVQNQKTSE